MGVEVKWSSLQVGTLVVEETRIWTRLKLPFNRVDATKSAGFTFHCAEMYHDDAPTKNLVERRSFEV